MKYYRTDYVSRDAEYLSDALLEHISEMIQIEHGIKLDGKEYVLVLDDTDADNLEERWNEFPDLKAVYVSSNVLFTTKQNEMLKNTKLYVIPDYYFNFELREEGETW